MNAYRTPAPPASVPVALSFDYAAELDRKRRRVVLNAFRGTFALVAIVGFYPFVALFGEIGFFVGLVAYAFIGVALAIQRAQTSPADEIQAYEEKLLRKRYR